jgi:ATP-dependent helicase/nuclease subunit A
MSTLRASDDTIARQLLASDPGVSAWVSANAGSGKTTVLSNRVIRLLLSGVEPSRILCLTFTKAAAANMSNRVFERLARWANAPEPDLDRALTALGTAKVDTAVRARARRLFARALETPGGLKVLTIHAFCERVLHQFPFEAGVPAAFTVLDDRQRNELVAAARAEVLGLAAGDETGALGRALTRLVTETSDGSMNRALGELLFRGDELAALMHPKGEDASARVASRMARAFGLQEGDSVENLNAEIIDEEAALATWPELTEWLRSGTPADHKLAACLDRARAAPRTQDRRAAYLNLCFTEKMALRSDKAFVTKALQKSRPDLYELLLVERERLGRLIERRKAAYACERSLALLTVADAVWGRYKIEKAQRGALDFGDLIVATKALVKDPGAAWVHYKLDQGVDHILVDEAQDTSPDQWDIITGLTSEFTAGESARHVTRTVFAVGDEKQSIFSFQGAAPAEFDHRRRAYASSHTAADLAFHPLQLTQSFRSTSGVLEAVDRVFSEPHAFTGLSSDGQRTEHDTARFGAPGRVDVWPVIEPAEKPDDERPWNAPLDQIAEKSPVLLLARRIAAAVRGWIRGEDALGPCPPVAEGEILILVRSRGALFEAILRELKNADVRVAGADRLELGRHIAVMDCLALADAITLPEDDLALACVLKSPLFDLDDDDLMRLAPGRKGSLRSGLRASQEPAFREADDRLARWSEAALRQRPFDFYAGVLSPGGGRRAFRGRLGGEVDDVLDEFLRLAMSYGETETATLSGFAAWMRAAPAEIKRDLDTGGSDVRVMTVHGAKGLEAKLVVLADFGCPRAASLAPVIYPLAEPGKKENDPDLLAWSLRKDDDPAPLTAAREREKEQDQAEHRRLLYVAMTRAADRLVIAGHVGQRTPSEGAWYDLVSKALDAPFAERHHVPAFGGDMIVYRTGEPVAEEQPPRDVPAPLSTPGWLHTPVAPEPAPPNWIAPSRALPHLHAVTAAPDDVPALERGRILHRLLEELPGVLPSGRDSAAAAYVARATPAWSVDQRRAVVDEALAIVADPQLADILSAQARSEVPITGALQRPDGTSVMINGRIDRLVVSPGRVLLVDFKSERQVPEKPPQAYVAQLALYRAVIARVFPGREIAGAILWTGPRRLDRIAAAELDAMLLRVLAMPALS